jgi:hypothetical protein
MSEQLYFFKFNKEIARTKLSTLINKDDSFSYKQYLFENFSKGEDNLQVNNIINKIDENIELLSTGELWSLFFWFSARVEKLNPNIEYYNLDNKVNEEMCNYGLYLFYEIPSKTPIRNLHELLGDYEFLTDQEIKNNCGADELIGFLNYIICYSGELTIFLNKYYYKNGDRREENLEIEQLIYDINSKSNNYFHNLALSELEKSMGYYNETMQLVPKLIEFRRANNDKSYTLPMELYEISEREDKIIKVAALLHIALGLKESINNYDGKIIRLHSY